MKLRLTAKLVALVTVPLLLFTAIVTAVQVVQEQSVVSAMTQALRVKSRAELTQVVSDVRTLCENANQATAQQLELDGAAFNRLLQEAGGVRIDESQRVTWDAKDQSTQATQQVGLGAMRVGKQWFGQTWDAKEPVPVVDRLRELVGGSASVMQRMNERGDMLRVATNVLGKDGRRGTGTYISHTNQDGSSNPIIDQVLAGNTFTGRVLIVDDWYLARYSPLRDERGRVFGMLMVGVRLNALADLKRSISQIKLGKTGYVWVVGAAGNERGKYIVSKGQSRDGESLWESKDAKGRRFMQDFVTHAEKLRGNEGFIEEYPWQNPHEPLRDKVAAVGYFEPWNWVIGASVYRDEAEASAADIQASMAALSKKTLALCLVSVGILIGIAVLLSRRMARPLSQLADVALLLSEGRVDVSIDHRSGDEIGTLADAFRALVLYFRTTADVARAIAAGDLQVVIAPRSEGDILSNNMAHATGVLRNLLQEITSLTKATREGDLSKRGNVDKYEGGYAALLQGMNGLLDAVAEPMQEVNRVLKCLAARNLTVRARDDFRGEYRSMVLSLNTATDNLSTSLQQVTIASGQVATASVEIAASSQSVAQGASEQASALEQTSSALIEMAASTKHNAANAERANVLAHDAKLASS
ncbi:MAG TPA: Cache 3/Cache 2 fusion domain-containing protein, partial [Polyangiaceae bacterium]